MQVQGCIHDFHLAFCMHDWHVNTPMLPQGGIFELSRKTVLLGALPAVGLHFPVVRDRSFMVAEPLVGQLRAWGGLWCEVAALLHRGDLLQDAWRSGTFMEWRPGFIRAVRDVLQVVRDGAEGFWAEASSFQGLAEAFWSSEECGKALGPCGLWQHYRTDAPFVGPSW